MKFDVPCDKCGHVFTDLRGMYEDIYVMGKKVTIPTWVRVCGVCENLLFDEELETQNLTRAYKKAKELYGIDVPV